MNTKPTSAELERRIQEFGFLKQVESNWLLNIIESMPYGVYISDQQHNIQYVNSEIKKEFGPINGGKCYTYLYDRSEICPWCKNDEVFSGKSVRWDRYSYKNDRYYDLFDMPLKNPDGTISKIQIFNDISELKRTQTVLKEKIKESEIKTRELSCLFEISKLFDQLGVSMQEIHQGIIELILRSLQHPEITCARLALKSKEVISKNFKQTPWALSSSISVYGKPYGELVVCYLEKRSEKDTSPFLAEEKEIIDAITKHLGKVLERKLVENKLFKSERRFRNLIEKSPMAISIVRGNKTIYRNPANKELTGASEFSTIFIAGESVHPDDVKMVTQKIQQLFSGQKNLIAMTFRFYPSDAPPMEKEIKWVYFVANLIEYQGNNAFLVYMHDLTRIKKLEDLLKEQDKLASLGRVAAGISHEIRNPLSGINIYLKTLEKRLGTIQDSKMDDIVSKILFQLQAASNKIESVIKRVMDFARPGEPNFILTNINHPITEAFNLSSVTLRKIGIQLTTDLAPDLPKCHADSQMIEQVILNLITNASEAMKDIKTDKKINLSSFFENKTVCICVSDSGPGIPKGLHNQIFDPFYTTKSTGSGIGLSICYRIIFDHGGSLELANKETGGAMFIIKIPASEGSDKK